jgi:hypothetical protein
MAKPRPSVIKRQREQLKREKREAKAEKKAHRQSDEIDMSELVTETPIIDTPEA